MKGFDFEKRGKEIERELLGVVRSKKERKVLTHESFIEFFDRMKKQEEKYFEIEKAIENVKELRSFLPTDPYPAFAFDVYTAVADTLEQSGIITEKEFDNLIYYTAIAPENEITPLDLFHGVDAFFELEKENEIYLVTLDLKTNPNYDPRSVKADIIHVVPPDFTTPATYKNRDVFPQVKDLTRHELKEYTKQYEELSKKVVDLFIKKIKIKL
jgi:hypothetical protein